MSAMTTDYHLPPVLFVADSGVVEPTCCRRGRKVLERNGVAISPRGRCAGSCSLEGLEGVSHLASRPATTVPAADLAGCPDLIERNFTAADAGG